MQCDRKYGPRSMSSPSNQCTSKINQFRSASNRQCARIGDGLTSQSSQSSQKSPEGVLLMCRSCIHNDELIEHSLVSSLKIDLAEICPDYRRGLRILSRQQRLRPGPCPEVPGLSSSSGDPQFQGEALVEERENPPTIYVLYCTVLIRCRYTRWIGDHQHKL